MTLLFKRDHLDRLAHDSPDQFVLNEIKSGKGPIYITIDGFMTEKYFKKKKKRLGYKVFQIIKKIAKFII